jgi:DNA-binding MarR family transcriptional regulator
MDAESDLADAVRTLVLATERFRAQRSRLHGLTPTTATALAHLHVSGAVTVGELARHLDIGAAAATEVVDKLERLGTVVRTRRADDRRKLVVHLTDHGREVIGEIYDEFTTRIEEAAARFDADQRTVIAAFTAGARDQLARPPEA